MNPNREFTWEKAQQTIDRLVFEKTGKHLSNLEIIILRGAWDSQTYEKIAEAEGYSSSYLSKDVGNKLWKNLSIALQEKVSKKNFKAALQRQYQKCDRAIFTQYQTQLLEFLTAENLTFLEGSVAIDSPFYIERSLVESVCYETIIQPGSLIQIKGAKWMGKTSLVNRIIEHGRIHGYKTVYLDFDRVDRSILRDLDKLLCWLCEIISCQLKLSNQVKEKWKTNILRSNNNCTVYFEEYVLGKITSEIVLAFDNIDRLFAYEEVLACFLKMWQNQHKNGNISYKWAKLKIILTLSSEVYIPLNIERSLFNAGVTILLEEFNYSQIKNLAFLYQLNWSESEIHKWMDLVGGHPYLVRLAMYLVKTQKFLKHDF
jgi:hypothetical protein